MKTLLLQTLAAKLHTCLYGKLMPHAHTQRAAQLDEQPAEKMVVTARHAQPSTAQEVAGDVSCPHPPDVEGVSTVGTETGADGLFSRYRSVCKLNSP